MNFYTIFRRDFINILCNPTLVVVNTVFPILLILILGYLSSGNFGSDITSYDYYGITVLIFSILSVSITASNSFLERRLKNSNLRILYSPIPPSFIYISKILATFLFTSVCFLGLMLFLYFVFHVNLGGKYVGTIILIILSFNFLTSTIGVLFCCILKSEELTNKILSTVNSIFALFGGLFFQLDGFGKTVERITYFSPVKWISEGMFKIIYDQDFSYFIPIIIICTILSVFFILICKMTFKTEHYV